MWFRRERVFLPTEGVPALDTALVWVNRGREQYIVTAASPANYRPPQRSLTGGHAPFL